MTQAAALAAYGSQGVSLGFKNRIINGAMMIDQRGVGSVTTPTNGQYTLDRWTSYAYNSAVGKYTVQQNAGSVTPPAGFTNYLGVTSTSAYSLGSGDITSIVQVAEGYSVADFGWGTSNAQPATLSFWVRSSLTGTFGGSFRNSAATRSYPFTYTINSANTWEYKTITVPGDTTGAWVKNNGQGLLIMFSLGTGTGYSGTPNTWNNGDYYAPTGATSVVGTNGATWYLTGVQLEKGSIATPFEYRDYTRELQLCQRYFWRNNYNGNWSLASGVIYGQVNIGRFTLQHPVAMRAAPSLSFNGNIRAGGGTASFPASSLSSQWTSPMSSLFELTLPSGNTFGFGTGLVVWSDAASTDWFQANAEL